MKSVLNITLLTVVCVISMAALGVRGASILQSHPKQSDHHKSRSYLLTLDHLDKGSASSIRPINNDSISPWEYTLVTDSDYIPDTISTAKCLLTGCLNAKGEEILDVESKPIMRQILVLKKVKADEKSYQLKLAYKTISVGCTCVRPYVQQV
ncbi:interleukin 17a/f1 [Colossoma macropomum]|uniref:interleukin 17a/f1 n=1 Tax=Colossoma macropomum TaxID=42526 RepID=UPI0018654C6B|nr:interleukin 17a/f1 [Colossoma macropomum]